MEELANSISDIVNVGDSSVNEDAQSYPIKHEHPSLEDIKNIIELVVQLSNHIETGRATINIEGDPDQYQIQYNPSRETVITKQTEGSEYKHENMYPKNPELVESLQDLAQGTVSNIENIMCILELLYDNERYFDIRFSYNLRKSNIEASIEDHSPIEVNSVVFFSMDRLINDLNSRPPEVFREEYLDENARCVFSVLNTDQELFSPAIGITSLNSTNNTLTKMGGSNLHWEEEIQDIATTALIENVESYLPPSVFQLKSIKDNLDPRLGLVFYRHRVLFSLLAISSNARHVGEGKWEIVIQGKQFIQGDLEFPTISETKVDETSVDLSEERVASIEELYRWVYQEGRSENRIDILRNVLTLYSRSMLDVVQDAEVIVSSANSNLRYYRKNSVDDFVDFRQEMIEGAIQTQRQFSELRSELMGGLSRDLFRTFGFIIAISAGIVIRVNEVFGENMLFVVSSVIVGIYTVVTHRRIKGIEEQYIVQTKNHKNLEVFYGRFFDDDELSEFGVQFDEKKPNWLDNNILSEQGNDEMTRRFRRDLAMYYGLLLAMAILAGVLASEVLQ